MNFKNSLKKRKLILAIIGTIFLIGLIVIPIVRNNRIKEKEKETKLEKKLLKEFNGYYSSQTEPVDLSLENGSATLCTSGGKSCTYPSYKYVKGKKFKFSDNNNYFNSCERICGYIDLTDNLYEGLNCTKANGDVKFLVKSKDAFSDYLLCGESDTEDEPKIPENAIAGFEELDIYITTEEFQKLSDSNTSYTHLDVLESLIDKKLFTKIYAKEKNKAEKSVNEDIELYKKSYGSEKKLLEAIKATTYYTSIKEYKEYLLLSYYRNFAIEEYVKEQISNYDIEEYYEDEVTGDMKVSHIMITPNIDVDMTDEQKSKAIDNAYNKAKDIIAKLDNGEDFAKLAKKYSEDESTKNKGGDLGYIKKEEISEYFFDASAQLEVGKYSKEPVKTEFGFHIILKTKQKKKPSLKKVKDDIISKLAKERIDMELIDSNTALREIRESKGLKIYDEDLSSFYDTYADELPHGYEYEDEEYQY